MLKNFAKGSAKGLLEESVQLENALSGQTGLMVVGRTPEDNTKIGEMLQDLDNLHAEWNAREGYWLFPEEEDLYDALEKELDIHFANYGIDARFEGIFAEGNAFTAGLAKTKKGGEFKVDGKEFKDTSNYDAPMKEEMASPKSKFENLSLEERNQLKQYIESVKEIKGAIKELVDKAKGMQEGGNRTELTMTAEDADFDQDAPQGDSYEEVVDWLDSKYPDASQYDEFVAEFQRELEHQSPEVKAQWINNFKRDFSTDLASAGYDGLTSSEEEKLTQQQALRNLGIDQLG